MMLPTAFRHLPLAAGCTACPVSGSDIIVDAESGTFSGGVDKHSCWQKVLLALAPTSTALGRLREVAWGGVDCRKIEMPVRTVYFEKDHGVSGFKGFIDPAGNDWVLVLDDAAQSFPPPGSPRTT
jgi:hypothetical protein